MTGVRPPAGELGQRVEEFIAVRRGLGYRSPSQERALRAFARHLDRAGHRGPIPLELSLDWATATASTDPDNPARRLGTVRGFLRHLAAVDGITQVHAPGLLGSTGHRMGFVKFSGPTCRRECWPQLLSDAENEDGRGFAVGPPARGQSSAAIVCRRSSASTSFMLAALRVLHVDSSNAAAGSALIEEWLSAP